MTTTMLPGCSETDGCENGAEDKSVMYILYHPQNYNTIEQEKNSPPIGLSVHRGTTFLFAAPAPTPLTRTTTAPPLSLYSLRISGYTAITDITYIYIFMYNDRRTDMVTDIYCLVYGNTAGPEIVFSDSLRDATPKIYLSQTG
ncbi:unnamed protein product [Cercopithifilaria johnstoni]|uniref:Uncharacterized protein n=1 Tax=Cercopithifilaria johnstoni TaxID=2874296 RepID=A0A8J2PRC7_9BILA|nr:unnamed protein product [Cercopithifilaria johnstoni]